MSAENIMCLVIYLFVAAIMLGIGIVQLRSENPVAFYSGEKPPRPEELTDVDAWNKKHGRMWVIYGSIIIITGVIGMLMGDTIWGILPTIGGVIIPLPVMIWYHKKLEKQYKKPLTKKS